MLLLIALLLALCFDFDTELLVRLMPVRWPRLMLRVAAAAPLSGCLLQLDEAAAAAVSAAPALVELWGPGRLADAEGIQHARGSAGAAVLGGEQGCSGGHALVRPSPAPSFGSLLIFV